MSKHQRDHHHGGERHQAAAQRRGLHKDWRVWVGVILMLAAMGAYVFTMDESIQPPAEPGGAPVNAPADAEPAAP